MQTLEAFQQSIIDYLILEKQFLQEDSEARKKLPLEEKVEKGFALSYAQIVNNEGMQYELSVEINNTKWRPGDKVLVTAMNSGIIHKAKLIENNTASISIECSTFLPDDVLYNIEIGEYVMLDAMIGLITNIKEGGSGAFFLKELAEIEQPFEEGLSSISENSIVLPERLNSVQASVCKKILKRPSIYCVQGPPGTGKTDVLSTIANIFSVRKKEVLIISNTHQAVNNALAKIHEKSNQSAVVKIGEALKAQDLDEEIVKAESYNDYLSLRKISKRHRNGDIVGMTLHAAIFNMGVRNSGFKPSIILVDEAGQIPLVQAAAIGTFGCGSVIFIGDDKQMPPIYHERLENHSLSVSIFHYLANLYPSFRERLSVTYRMNEEITKVVSSNFYENDGVPLISSDFSKNRELILNSKSDDEKIRGILNMPPSIQRYNVTRQDIYEDQNIEEASFIAHLVKEAIACGMNISDIAVITPYRRQVRLIREKVIEELQSEEVPLIDTVERLQGQDVDLIILSFSVSSPQYFKTAKSFLFNPNRLNVMISRAKKKVVIIASDIVQKDLIL